MVVQGIVSVLLVASLGDATAVCESGKYWRLGQQCRDCPSGQYTNMEAQRQCKNCPRGKYQSSEGASSKGI